MSHYIPISKYKITIINLSTSCYYLIRIQFYQIELNFKPTY